jgi:hypothetical protein
VRIVQLTSGPRCMHMQDLISHGPHVSHSSAPCFRRDGPHRIFFRSFFRLVLLIVSSSPTIGWPETCVGFPTCPA